MDQRRSKSGLLIGLFLLGSVLFNFPILTLFNQRIALLGIPLLYLYIFIVWTVLILAIMRVTKIRAPDVRPKAPNILNTSYPVDRKQ